MRRIAVLLSAGAVGLGAATAIAAQPVARDALLCGVWAQGSDNIAGNSNVDHPAGAAASGQYYSDGSTSCASHYSGGSFAAGDQSFTWSISHSNVNLNSETGTEHGLFTLEDTNNLAAGFQGHVLDYDFNTPNGPGDPST